MSNLNKQSSFFQDVYELVQLIPPGRVSTYGAIAQYLGRKGSARMVGWALNAAITLPEVPAHRVLNRLGRLSGKAHFGEATAMQRLLEAEGHRVISDQVQDFHQKFWDPNQELRT